MRRVRCETGREVGTTDVHVDTTLEESTQNTAERLALRKADASRQEDASCPRCSPANTDITGTSLRASRAEIS